MQHNPDNLKPARGHAIVEITEVLGGLRAGVFVPAEDHMRKDTAIVRVLKLGPPSRRRHAVRFSMQPPLVTPADHVWPDGYPGIEEGDQIAVPRDVPKAFGWEGKRYAIIDISEVLLKIPDDLDVEVVPWPERKVKEGSVTTTYGAGQWG